MTTHILLLIVALVPATMRFFSQALEKHPRFPLGDAVQYHLTTPVILCFLVGCLFSVIYHVVVIRRKIVRRVMVIAYVRFFSGLKKERETYDLFFGLVLLFSFVYITIPSNQHYRLTNEGRANSLNYNSFLRHAKRILKGDVDVLYDYLHEVYNFDLRNADPRVSRQIEIEDGLEAFAHLRADDARMTRDFVSGNMYYNLVYSQFYLFSDLFLKKQLRDAIYNSQPNPDEPLTDAEIDRLVDNFFNEEVYPFVSRKSLWIPSMANAVRYILGPQIAADVFFLYLNTPTEIRAHSMYEAGAPLPDSKYFYNSKKRKSKNSKIKKRIREWLRKPHPMGYYMHFAKAMNMMHYLHSPIFDIRAWSMKEPLRLQGFISKSYTRLEKMFFKNQSIRLKILRPWINATGLTATGNTLNREMTDSERIFYYGQIEPFQPEEYASFFQTVLPPNNYYPYHMVTPRWLRPINAFEEMMFFSVPKPKVLTEAERQIENDAKFHLDMAKRYGPNYAAEFGQDVSAQIDAEVSAEMAMEQAQMEAERMNREFDRRAAEKEQARKYRAALRAEKRANRAAEVRSGMLSESRLKRIAEVRARFEEEHGYAAVPGFSESVEPESVEPSYSSTARLNRKLVEGEMIKRYLEAQIRIGKFYQEYRIQEEAKKGSVYTYEHDFSQYVFHDHPEVLSKLVLSPVIRQFGAPAEQPPIFVEPAASVARRELMREQRLEQQEQAREYHANKQRFEDEHGVDLATRVADRTSVPDSLMREQQAKAEKFIEEMDARTAAGAGANDEIYAAFQRMLQAEYDAEISAEVCREGVRAKARNAADLIAAAAEAQAKAVKAAEFFDKIMDNSYPAAPDSVEAGAATTLQAAIRAKLAGLSLKLKKGIAAKFADERLAKIEADQAAKREAELAAKIEADQAAKRAAEQAVQLEAELAAKRAAELAAKREADQAAKRAAELAAKIEADQAAKRAAEQAAPKVKPDPEMDIADKLMQDVDILTVESFEAIQMDAPNALAKFEALEVARKKLNDYLDLMEGKMTQAQLIEKDAKEWAAQASKPKVAKPKPKEKDEATIFREANKALQMGRVARRKKNAAEQAAKREAQLVAQLEAELAAKIEAEKAAKRAAKQAAKIEAELAAKREAELAAKIEAELAAKIEAELAAQLEAELALKRAAEQAAQLEAEAATTLQAAIRAKLAELSYDRNKTLKKQVADRRREALRDANEQEVLVQQDLKNVALVCAKIAARCQRDNSAPTQEEVVAELTAVARLKQRRAVLNKFIAVAATEEDKEVADEVAALSEAEADDANQAAREASERLQLKSFSRRPDPTKFTTREEYTREVERLRVEAEACEVEFGAKREAERVRDLEAERLEELSSHLPLDMADESWQDMDPVTREIERMKKLSEFHGVPFTQVFSLEATANSPAQRLVKNVQNPFPQPNDGSVVIYSQATGLPIDHAEREAAAKAAAKAAARAASEVADRSVVLYSQATGLPIDHAERASTIGSVPSRTPSPTVSSYDLDRKSNEVLASGASYSTQDALQSVGLHYSKKGKMLPPGPKLPEPVEVPQEPGPKLPEPVEVPQEPEVIEVSTENAHRVPHNAPIVFSNGVPLKVYGPYDYAQDFRGFYDSPEPKAQHFGGFYDSPEPKAQHSRGFYEYSQPKAQGLPDVIKNYEAIYNDFLAYQASRSTSNISDEEILYLIRHASMNDGAMQQPTNQPKKSGLPEKGRDVRLTNPGSLHRLRQRYFMPDFKRKTEHGAQMSALNGWTDFHDFQRLSYFLERFTYFYYTTFWLSSMRAPARDRYSFLNDFDVPQNQIIHGDLHSFFNNNSWFRIETTPVFYDWPRMTDSMYSYQLTKFSELEEFPSRYCIEQSETEASAFSASLFDFAHAGQIGFQNSAAPSMEGIIDLHHDLMFFLITIVVFVMWLLVSVVQNYYLTDENGEEIATMSLIPSLKSHNVKLETVWSISPACVLVAVSMPSFALIYELDDVLTPGLTLRVIGHQWYWSYEYANTVSTSKHTAYSRMITTAFKIDPYFIKDFRNSVEQKSLYWNAAVSSHLYKGTDFLEKFSAKSVRYRIIESTVRMNYSVREAILLHKTVTRLANEDMIRGVYSSRLEPYVSAKKQKIIAAQIQSHKRFVKPLQKLFFFHANKGLLSKYKHLAGVYAAENTAADIRSSFYYVIKKCYGQELGVKTQQRRILFHVFKSGLQRYDLKVKLCKAYGISLQELTFARMPAFGMQALMRVRPDFFSSTVIHEKIMESRMILEPELIKGQLRLLNVSNRVVLPVDTDIRIVVTSTDVLHSWAVPALGFKLDACPGRLNQAPLYIKRTGVFYGQCSELCGVGHAFMPIVIEAVSREDFEKWINEYSTIRIVK